MHVETFVIFSSQKEKFSTTTNFFPLIFLIYLRVQEVLLGRQSWVNDNTSYFQDIPYLPAFIANVVKAVWIMHFMLKGRKNANFIRFNLCLYLFIQIKEGIFWLWKVAIMKKPSICFHLTSYQLLTIQDKIYERKFT